MSEDILQQEQSAKTQFSAALSERYLAYALSTITSRSLPDVRDGLEARSPAATFRHASVKT